MKTALVAGATGLIGSHLTTSLLKDPDYSKVFTISRKPIPIVDEKHINIVTDFDKLGSFENELRADHVFCCLGTTMKRAKSKEAFWKVDHDYPVMLATLGKNNGAEKFMLVSALGADRSSSFYYNQVKGHVESDIETLGFDAYHIFRPSLLLGDRDESRPGEDAAKFFYKWFNFLIPQKYKGIEGRKVAEAMRHFAKSDLRGKHIHESSFMQSF